MPQPKIPNADVSHYVEEVHGVSIAPHTFDQMRWRNEGPPYYRIAGRIYYAPEALAKWIESHRKEPRAS